MSIVFGGAEFPDGLSVRELKAIISGWPEEKEDGELTRVYITSGEELSSPVGKIWPLNPRASDKGEFYPDFLLALR